MKYPKRSQYKHAKQKKYHVRNWAEYNEGLRRRGDLTVWFDEEAIANWKADKTGKPGGQRVYSDMAIETGLVVRMVYKLAYRQTEGFLHSIASLLGLGIEIPDYSTLCRRSRLLRKKLRIPKAASTQPIHLMIDSTGLRIHVGNARKPPKQRAWRKLHIAVDRKTGTIVASELTASRARDATRVPALLTQIQAPLVSVAADSAYDKEAVYEAIEAHSPGRRTRVVIPPQRNATLSQNSNTAMQERDRHIRAIERHGRREWYKLSGYTKRSMVENAVYRYKAIIGPEMRARTLARQRVEHRIGCEILNKMAATLGDARYVRSCSGGAYVGDSATGTLGRSANPFAPGRAADGAGRGGFRADDGAGSLRHRLCVRVFRFSWKMTVLKIRYTHEKRSCHEQTTPSSHRRAESRAVTPARSGEKASLGGMQRGRNPAEPVLHVAKGAIGWSPYGVFDPSRAEPRE